MPGNQNVDWTWGLSQELKLFLLPKRKGEEGVMAMSLLGALVISLALVKCLGSFIGRQNLKTLSRPQTHSSHKPALLPSCFLSASSWTVVATT